MEKDRTVSLASSQISRFRIKLQKGFFLRFHMSLILLGVFFSGLIASKLLLKIGLHSMPIRYPVVVVFSYLMFFLFIRLWLHYIQKASHLKSSDSGFVDVPLGVDSGTGPSVGGPDFPGPQGGTFGGAGASGNYGDSSSVSGQFAATAAGHSEGSSWNSGLGDIDLDKGWLVLAVLGLLLALIFGVGIYVIYAAPTILSEAAVQIILAASFIKASKRMNHPDWVGSIFKATWIPLVIVLSLSVTIALVSTHYFPGITKLTEVLKK
jgi:hypothetical protein